MHQLATPEQTNPRRELQLLIGSRLSLVFVDTVEEERARALVRDAALACGRSYHEWSITKGVRLNGVGGVDDTTRPPDKALQFVEQTRGFGVYVMSGLVDHFDDRLIVRLLHDVAVLDGPTIVVVGENPAIPDSLRIHSGMYELPRPDLTLIDIHVRTLLQQLQHRRPGSNQLLEAEVAQMAHALRGLTLEEVDFVMTRLVEEDARIDFKDIPRALDHKSELLARGGVVELSTPEHGLEWIAGFNDFKAWAQHRAAGFTASGAAFGLEAPRGVLLTGVPGCGKSAAVKALARDWNMPLLRLDAGNLYDKFVGASEKNLRRALQVAASLAPSVLWIDEIEKSFGGQGPSEADGGLTYRMVGMLTTWLQERDAPVFVAATSNDVTLLPPELTRQGRFDDVFFVDLPALEERAHLFALQLARRGRNWEAFDCTSLAAAAPEFSGAEIEQSVVNALYSAYAEGVELTTDHIRKQLAETRPLSVLSPARVSSIRAWGRQHARPA